MCVVRLCVALFGLVLRCFVLLHSALLRSVDATFSVMRWDSLHVCYVALKPCASCLLILVNLKFSGWFVESLLSITYRSPQIQYLMTLRLLKHQLIDDPLLFFP